MKTESEECKVIKSMKRRQKQNKFHHFLIKKYSLFNSLSTSCCFVDSFRPIQHSTTKDPSKKNIKVATVNIIPGVFVRR